MVYTYIEFKKNKKIINIRSFGIIKMESHIDLKVPSDVGRMLDADEGDARSIRLSKGQAEDLNLNEEEYNSENYQILRELIHDLQLKSAIDRQNMQKTERSIRETAEEIQNT